MDTMQTSSPSALPWLALSAVVVAADQVTKQWINSTIDLCQGFINSCEKVEVTSFINLIHLHNEGAAFSFLADAGGWQRWFIVTLAFGVSIFIIAWLSRLPRHQYWLAMALALILAGAIGNNLSDRLLFGYVIDFIDVYYQNWHFPTFNVADSAISVGAVMLLIDAFFGNSEEES
ncbi:MAG: signal peptidase II [Pseudomonadota bacterium]